jgi:hypothetical protein
MSSKTLRDAAAAAAVEDDRQRSISDAAKLRRELARVRETLAAAQRDKELAEQRVARLMDQQRARIERIARPTRQKKAKTRIRFIVPDSHGCFIDPDAAAAMLADMEMLRPESVVMLGDHMDCGGFLAEHHTWGYVAEADYTFEDDCGAANDLLDAIQARSSGQIDYIEGNHERRIEKWILTSVLKSGKGSQRDADLLRKMFSTESVLHLAARGVSIFKQGVCYDGCKIPATIYRDNCYFTHGSITSKHAAYGMLGKFSSNIWFGHTHRADMYAGKTVRSGAIRAFNPGCLCRFQPLWLHTQPEDWGHGYGLQVITDGWKNSSGVGHLNLQIPIIDGRSYLPAIFDHAQLDRPKPKRHAS